MLASFATDIGIGMGFSAELMKALGSNRGSNSRPLKTAVLLCSLPDTETVEMALLFEQLSRRLEFF